jgi:hypothetical protein
VKWGESKAVYLALMSALKKVASTAGTLVANLVAEWVYSKVEQKVALWVHLLAAL